MCGKVNEKSTVHISLATTIASGYVTACIHLNQHCFKETYKGMCTFSHFEPLKKIISSE